MNSLLKLSLLCISALPLLVGCAASEDPAEPTRANDDALTLDFCRTAVADKVTSINGSTDFVTAKSVGNTYASDAACKFFLWDVTPSVNTDLGASAYPISMPKDSLSCWNFTVRERQYVKGATGFDLVYSLTSKGQWSSGVCTLKQSSESGTQVPYVGKAGVTYRLAISASVLETGPDITPYTTYVPVAISLMTEPQ